MVLLSKGQGLLAGEIHLPDSFCVVLCPHVLLILNLFAICLLQGDVLPSLLFLFFALHLLAGLVFQPNLSQHLHRHCFPLQYPILLTLQFFLQLLYQISIQCFLLLYFISPTLHYFFHLPVSCSLFVINFTFYFLSI